MREIVEAVSPPPKVVKSSRAWSCYIGVRTVMEWKYRFARLARPASLILRGEVLGVLTNVESCCMRSFSTSEQVSLLRGSCLRTIPVNMERALEPRMISPVSRETENAACDKPFFSVLK